MQNNNDNGAAMAFAFVSVLLFFVGAFVFAAAAFLSLLLTIFCIYCLLCGPVQLGGETVTPEEALGVLRRGALGAIGVPVFALFSAKLLGFQIRQDWMGYLVIGGYAFGSLVVSYWIAQAEAEAAAAAQQAQLLAPPLAPPKTITTQIEHGDYRNERYDVQSDKPPFRFASWDDEEELRK